MTSRLLILIATILTFLSCQQNSSSLLIDQATTLRDSIKQVYAPDGRVAIFKIDIKSETNTWYLSGESDKREAVDALVENLSKSAVVANEIKLLPDESIIEYPYAVVNNSVANIRSKPKHSAELATQATLGTVLKVLKNTKEWYLIQTPDDYIAWVDHGGVQLMTPSEIEVWQKSKKVIVVTNMTEATDEQGTRLSDLVLGDIMEKLSSDKETTTVRFPDGRMGIVSNATVMDYDLWLSQLSNPKELIENYARNLLGAPYLWGGTSTKGMDCSGFTKTVYFMNGLVIPRDASQQVHAGKVVDENLTFEGLEIGDLLFFGRPATDSTKQRTTHVGIWLGNDEFIHASKRVRISSIDPSSPNYDEFNKNRYLGTRRYLNNLEGNIIDLRASLTLK